MEEENRLLQLVKPHEKKKRYYNIVYSTNLTKIKLEKNGKLGRPDGYRHSDTTKQKMSESAKKRTDWDYMKRPKSKETRAKIAKSLKGHPGSPNSGRKNTTQSPEERKKRSESLKGRTRAPFSAEWKRKLSEAAKNRYKKVN